MIRLLFVDVWYDIAQVLAVPLVVVPENNNPSVNLRLGHAAADRGNFVVKTKKGPCHASRISQKAVEVSNLFREALGLPLIKSVGHPGPDDGRVNISPFVGTPNTFVHDKGTEGPYKVMTFVPLPPHAAPPHAHGRHRHHMSHHRFGKGSFLNRIHYSIMNLGRWEGRAVAFVLGKIFQPSLYIYNNNIDFPCLCIDQGVESEFSSGCSLFWLLSCSAL